MVAEQRKKSEKPCLLHKNDGHVVMGFGTISQVDTSVTVQYSVFFGQSGHTTVVRHGNRWARPFPDFPVTVINDVLPLS